MQSSRLTKANVKVLIISCRFESEIRSKGGDTGQALKGHTCMALRLGLLRWCSGRSGRVRSSRGRRVCFLLLGFGGSSAEHEIGGVRHFGLEGLRFALEFGFESLNFRHRRAGGRRRGGGGGRRCGGGGGRGGGGRFGVLGLALLAFTLLCAGLRIGGGCVRCSLLLLRSAHTHATKHSAQHL
jgi:hypothetical protein